MREETLAKFVDKRITIAGAFEKLALVFRSERNIHTALFQDAVAYVEDKEYDLGHVWVQRAEEFRPHKLVPGDRIRFECRVQEYRKRLDVPNERGFTWEIKHSLIYPRKIEVIYRNEPEGALQVTLPEQHSRRPESPQRLEPNQLSVNPVELVREVRRIAALAGGVEPLRQLLEILG
jgi:hypothetical protein